jgi:hypothetical protein
MHNMVKQIVMIEIIFIAIFCLTNCQLNQSFVKGVWYNGRDTLKLNNDGKFIYSDHRGFYNKVDGKYDNTTDYRMGKWFTCNGCLTLVFEQDMYSNKLPQISYCRRLGQIGRRKVYNHIDTFPSNRFQVFTKVRKR